MAAKVKTFLFLSKMDIAEFTWSPEQGSPRSLEEIPLREPLCLTLARVGGSIPFANTKTFAYMVPPEYNKRK